MWAYTCPAEKDVAWPSDLSLLPINTLQQCDYSLLFAEPIHQRRYRQHLAHINDSICIEALVFATWIRG